MREESHDIVHVAMVAGETSGDRLGAGLIAALRERYPNARFYGVGGPAMASAGFDVQYDMDRIGVMGFDGLREKLKDILQIRKTLMNTWSEDKPDIFIGIDVPDFNLKLERHLKAANIPSVHYVSPTVWAWRGYRIHNIKRSVSHMLALFPFEADYYRRHDIPVTCVGHPMADQIDEPCAASARKTLELHSGSDPQSIQSPVIALLPGSRRSEVKRLIKPLIEAAKILHKQYPSAVFILPFAKPALRQLFTQIAGKIDELPLRTFDGQSRQVLEAADVAILASGTASLEAALLRVPHVVVYKLSGFSYWIMRRLRQVDHFAMPNHLMEKPIVPELIQHQVTPEHIVEQVQRYLENPTLISTIKKQFSDIHKTLKLDANQRAAEVVATVIENHRDKKR